MQRLYLICVLLGLHNVFYVYLLSLDCMERFHEKSTRIFAHVDKQCMLASLYKRY